MRASVVRRFPITLIIVSVLFAASASAATVTVATFADPAADGSTPLFTLSGDTLSGGWAGSGLELLTPFDSGAFPDATFAMTDLTVLNPGGTLSAGAIEFFDQSSSLLLRIDFESGLLYSPFGFGASTLYGNNVTFSGPIVSFQPSEESFAFSFANQATTPGGSTWTAAFTSSAVPEPAALVMLGLGGLAMGLTRRRA
jgi:hypothetical protein